MIELDRGHQGAGVEQAAVSSPSPGPISSTRRPGTGDAASRIASRTSASARKFWLRLCRARRPASFSVRRTPRRVDVGGARRHDASQRRHDGRRRASGSDGRASSDRSARSPAANRRAPAAPIIAPLSVHSAGRGTISGRPRASASPASRVRSAPFAATPPPRTIDRAPGRLGRADRLRDEHVDDGVLEAPRELGGRRRPTGGRRARARRRAPVGRPSPARASSIVRRAAVFSPLKLKS